MDIKLKNNSVVVTSERNEILNLDDFPVSELKEQLRNWLATVTEINAKCFVFEPPNANESGVFRIEPRPNGWQFTSSKESVRSSEILPLHEWREVLESVL